MTTIAEVFPPGEFLKDELEARGWSQTELAEIMDRPVRLINEIIAGKKAITPETATQLGASLGTGAELWMNLEGQYQLSRVRTSDGQVARRARLYERFPVREMIRRGWIESSRNIEVLEQQFREFFDLRDLDDEVVFSHAPKKSPGGEAPSRLQLAWLYRAKRLAAQADVPPYSSQQLRKALPDLAALMSAAEEARQVSGVLAECGVRFVVVESIPGAKLDGACFWLAAAQPVIALSLRLDRIDNFWFVLRHEIEHVLRGHGRERGFVIDQDLEGAVPEQQGDDETVANLAATRFCVGDSAMSRFVANVGPYYSDERVTRFARELSVHPGIVVGQLQRRLRRYDLLRKHQVKVRSFVTATTLTDGWGSVPSGTE